MGPRLGQSLRLGLESVPRLATSRWSVRSGGLRALGSATAVGAAAATCAAVGTRGQCDVEPDGQRLGILEQQHMDPDLT